jgi:hypothetical protein
MTFYIPRFAITKAASTLTDARSLTRRDVLISMHRGIACIAGAGVLAGEADDAQAAPMGAINLRPSKLAFRPREPINGAVIFSNFGTRRIVVDGVMRVSINGISINMYRYNGQVALEPRETGKVVQIANFVDSRGESPAAPSLTETQSVDDIRSGKPIDFRASAGTSNPNFGGDDIPLKVGLYF